MTTFKQFSEDSEIRYLCTVWVNGEESGSISSYTEDGLWEDSRKLDNAINTTLERQFEELPENMEQEDEDNDD